MPQVYESLPMLKKQNGRTREEADKTFHLYRGAFKGSASKHRFAGPHSVGEQRIGCFYQKAGHTQVVTFVVETLI